jgi:signal transduction histidine kinase
LRRVYAAVALQRLALRLGPSAGRRELRVAMAAALEDPSLRLLTWRSGERGGWVDEGGRPAAIPEPGGPSDVTEVRAEGRPVAAIIQDRALGQDPVVVRAAGSYATAILENRRLVERLQSSLHDLSLSRARLMAIADETRRRIERDLHDGAQQRLIGLRIKLSMQSEKLEVDSPGSAAALAAMGDEVEEAIGELRALAHGIYPSLLTDRGLPAALTAIVRDAAIPTALDSDGVGRYPPEVESTVYFACLEALQNAEKHATGATQVRIRLRDEGGLSFEVRDDGAGFDVADAADHRGFTSLYDRLDAVGGRLEVRSHPGAGTSVRGLIPADPRSR